MNIGYLSLGVTFAYQHVSHLFVNVVIMFTQLQLLSVHYPSCDGCARDIEESRMQKEFGRKNVVKERLSVIFIITCFYE